MILQQGGKILNSKYYLDSSKCGRVVDVEDISHLDLLTNSFIPLIGIDEVDNIWLKNENTYLNWNTQHFYNSVKVEDEFKISLVTKMGHDREQETHVESPIANHGRFRDKKLINIFRLSSTDIAKFCDSLTYSINKDFSINENLIRSLVTSLDTKFIGVTTPNLINFTINHDHKVFDMFKERCLGLSLMATTYDNSTYNIWIEVEYNYGIYSKRHSLYRLEGFSKA
jgi:hypothetical protein